MPVTDLEVIVGFRIKDVDAGKIPRIITDDVSGSASSQAGTHQRKQRRGAVLDTEQVEPGSGQVAFLIGQKVDHETTAVLDARRDGCRGFRGRPEIGEIAVEGPILDRLMDAAIVDVADDPRDDPLQLGAREAGEFLRLVLTPFIDGAECRSRQIVDALHQGSDDTFDTAMEVGGAGRAYLRRDAVLLEAAPEA